ncbi:MAG: outer membrane protein assembly factor BamE [Burkholderiales bacterium]|nr:outer membrane protein assembly factor BamE [Burkholderiales bacterium]
MRLPALLLPLVACLALTGCESLQRTDSFMGFITPYRIDIVQGNVVTKEQMALIKPGSTRLQVRDALGTPLLADPFHANRWDYIFTLRRPGTELQRRSVVVLFDGDVVKSVEAPDLPTEQEFVASISRYKDIKPPPLELNDEERLALPLPVKRESPADEPVGPVRDYPPLERS